MDKKYSYGTPIQCVICRAVFKTRDKTTTQSCCSNACRGALQTQRATKACVTCGKSFVSSRPSYQSCSRVCGTAWRLSRHTQDPLTLVRKKLAQFCCGTIHRCLRSKTDRTWKLLGYTVEDLRAHLEAYFKTGMGWHNYGKKVGQWSIDHTKPISAFSPLDSVLTINALENLRPMWHAENCSKRNTWEGH